MCQAVCLASWKSWEFRPPQSCARPDFPPRMSSDRTSWSARKTPERLRRGARTSWRRLSLLLVPAMAIAVAGQFAIALCGMSIADIEQGTRDIHW